MKELQCLEVDARRSQANAFALGTFDNYLWQWVNYLQFCIYFQLAAFPANQLVLVWYVQFLSRRMKSHGSVLGYLCGAKKLHLLLNFNTKGFNGFILKLTLQGLRRLNNHVVKQALPITPFILEWLHAVLDHDHPDNAVFWCAVILGFFLLFRKSNLIPNTKFGFNGEKQLQWTDMVFTKFNVIVGIRWTKNHQFGNELLTFPLPRIPGSPLCPVSALLNLRRLVKVKQTDHMLSLKGGGSLTYPVFQDSLRSGLRAAGIQNAEAFSSHSLRRGGCSFAFMCGIPSEIIQLLGNWKSQSYLQYLHFLMEARTAASELMKIRIMHSKFRY